MYRFAILLSSTIFLLAGCSSEDNSAITVDCDRRALGSATVDCNGNDADPAPVERPTIVVHEAGCFMDSARCPQAFAMSWLVEHCTIAYACPVVGSDPQELVCLRFIQQDCWDKNSN